MLSVSLLIRNMLSYVYFEESTQHHNYKYVELLLHFTAV